MKWTWLWPGWVNTQVLLPHRWCLTSDSRLFFCRCPGCSLLLGVIHWKIRPRYITLRHTIGPAVRADFRRLYPANAKTPTCCPSDDNRTKVTNSVTSARSLWWHVGPYFWPADLTRTANPINLINFLLIKGALPTMLTALYNNTSVAGGQYFYSYISEEPDDFQSAGMTSYRQPLHADWLLTWDSPDCVCSDDFHGNDNDDWQSAHMLLHRGQSCDDWRSSWKQ